MGLRNKTGFWTYKSNAAARGSRTEGRVCGTVSDFSSRVRARGRFYRFNNSTKKRPEQRARRWRAACPYSVFKPIKDGINSWIREVGNALMDGWNGYEGSGNIDSNKINKINEVIFLSPFFILFRYWE